MTKGLSELNVTDVARLLEVRKNAHRSTVLFLGARTGGLFRSRILYETCQMFSARSFYNLSQIEQFGECYRVLNQEHFSGIDIDTILHTSLHYPQISEADLCLAELVKSGFFDVIVTTNVDNLLEKAFVHIGMKEKYDFCVITPQNSYTGYSIDSMLKLSCTTVKVFGDLAKGEHTLIGKHSNQDKHSNFEEFLISLLEMDTLVLGFDPLWDKVLKILFPLQGQNLWFVNEEKPAEDSYIFRLLQHRKGKYIIGGEGSYDRFMKALHWHILGARPFDYQATEEKVTGLLHPFVVSPIPEVSQEYNIPVVQQENVYHASSVPAPLQKAQRQRIFIGYCQKDKKHMLQLQIHLASYERSRLVDTWDDTKIAAGTNWLGEIQRALDATRIAILLVSADFIASNFIAENILPPLLKAAETSGAIILPVIVSYCAFEDTPLQYFRPVNNLSKPLNKMKVSDRDEVWTNLVRYVMTLVKDA